jgi:hypothetical protein
LNQYHFTRYRLDVEVEDVDDEEETAKFVFWDSTLNDLLGISAKDLIAKMKKVLNSPVTTHFCIIKL